MGYIQKITGLNPVGITKSVIKPIIITSNDEIGRHDTLRTCCEVIVACEFDSHFEDKFGDACTKVDERSLQGLFCSLPQYLRIIIVISCVYGAMASMNLSKRFDICSTQIRRANKKKQFFFATNFVFLRNNNKTFYLFLNKLVY